MTNKSAIDAAALDWVIRQRDPAFSDWEGFTAWLEAGPSHLDAYHEVVALDEGLDALPPAPAPESSEPTEPNVFPLRRGYSRRAWLTGAVAASLVGVLSFSTFLRSGPDSYRVETALGESRTIALDDGSRIILNGGTAMQLSHDRPREATLERGQASFVVVHREDAPFKVTVGEAQLVDVGTVFDVVRVQGELGLAVSEGAVVYNPSGANVRVDAGRRLVVRDGSSQAELSAVDPAAVGGWRQGQLVYDGTSLEQVVAEVGRTTGIRIRTAPDVASVSFRGALQTGSDEERLVNDLAALSGTSARRDEKGWMLVR